MGNKYTIAEKQVSTTTHTVTYEVEADSYEDALQSVQDGLMIPVEECSDGEFGETVYTLTGVEEFNTNQ